MLDARAAFRSAILEAHERGELDRLSASQRAMLGARHVVTTHGGARHRGAGFKPLRSPVTYSTVCDVLAVGPKLVGYARRLLNSDRADLVDAVRAGRLTLAEAVRRV